MSVIHTLDVLNGKIMNYYSGSLRNHILIHSLKKIRKDAVCVKPFPDDDFSWVVGSLHPLSVLKDGCRMLILLSSFRIFQDGHRSNIKQGSSLPDCPTYDCLICCITPLHN